MVSHTREYHLHSPLPSNMSLHSTMTSCYNAHSNPQHQTACEAINRFMPIAIDNIHRYNQSHILNNHHITIVDYGCAGAKNSVIAIDSIIQKILHSNSILRVKMEKDEKGDQQHSNTSNVKHTESIKSITVIYNDQPTNDWNVTVNTVINYHHHQSPNIIHHTLFSPLSFYQQICANDSVTIAYSNGSMHWLSSTPCPLNNHILPYCRLDQMIHDNDIIAWKQQAANDWITLLTQRYHEMKHGAVWLINMLGCSDDDNDSMIGSSKHLYNMFQSFVNDGLMTHEQLRQYSWPCYGRTIDEVLEPITKQVNGIQYRVLNDDTRSNILTYTENPIYTSYRDMHHNAMRYAHELIQFYRAIASNAQLYACDMNVKQCEKIWHRWEEYIVKHPDMNWVSTRINMITLMLMKI